MTPQKHEICFRDFWLTSYRGALATVYYRPPLPFTTSTGRRYSLLPAAAASHQSQCLVLSRLVVRLWLVLLARSPQHGHSLQCATVLLSTSHTRDHSDHRRRLYGFAVSLLLRRSPHISNSRVAAARRANLAPRHRRCCTLCNACVEMYVVACVARCTRRVLLLHLQPPPSARAARYRRRRHRCSRCARVPLYG